MDPQLPSLIATAFALGGLHALDADHVLAVSGFSDRGRSTGYLMNFCLRWASGHGLTLIVLGTLVTSIGFFLPARVTGGAELVIGVMLLGMGIVVGVRLVREFLRHIGDHSRLQPHHHLPLQSVSTQRHHHGLPIAVGVMHGIAGSTQLLALAGTSDQHAPWLALLYIAVFSIGTLLAMMLFGLLLSKMRRSSVGSPRLSITLRVATGLLCLVTGTYMILGIAL